MKTTLLALVIFGSIGCRPSDRYQVVEGPARAAEMVEFAWRWYGRADKVGLSFVWLAPDGDCDEGRGFHDAAGMCVWATYDPAISVAWTLNREDMYPVRYGKDGETTSEAFSRRASSICHETLHAVIDSEQGVTFEVDSGHADPRWGNDEVSCRVALTAEKMDK